MCRYEPGQYNMGWAKAPFSGLRAGGVGFDIYEKHIYNQYMKAISIYVPEGDYQEIKSLSARAGRPIAELIRQAMAEYLVRQRGTARSILNHEPHQSGDLLKAWGRTELLDEMLKR